MVSAGAGGALPQRRHLPTIVVVDLRRGNVEAVVDAGDKGLEDLALALEGLVLGKAQPDPAQADGHASRPGRVRPPRAGGLPPEATRPPADVRPAGEASQPASPARSAPESGRWCRTDRDGPERGPGPPRR